MMRGQSQEAFFARIKAALADRSESVDLPDDLEIARVVSSDQDVVEVFAARVEESGGRAYRVADEQGLADRIAGIVEAGGGKRAIVPDEEIPRREEIISKLEANGVALLDPDDPDASFEADFGITAVAGAVAETASMCVESGGGRRRMASLAVPNHIGIVRADQIVPDLLDWTAAAPADMPANRTLISAPSKTADIEMIIIEGVHGPKTEHVIILE